MLFSEIEDIELLRGQENAASVIIWALFLIILIFNKNLSQITDYRKGKIFFTPFQVLSWFFFVKKRKSEENEELGKWKYIAFTQFFSFLILFLINRVLFFISIFVPENWLTWVLLILDIVLVLLVVVIWVKSHTFPLKKIYIVGLAIYLLAVFEVGPIIYVLCFTAIAATFFMLFIWTNDPISQVMYWLIFGASTLYFCVSSLIVIYKGNKMLLLNSACYVTFYACTHSLIIEIYLNKIEQHVNELEKFIKNFGDIFGLISCIISLIGLMS